MRIARCDGIARWGGFELDVRTGELRKPRGKIVRLSEQPLRLLVALLECPGELVLREDLRKRLWPNDTVVGFEQAISAAMNRLRQALGDSADTPKFIETLARRGYRWKTPVEWAQPEPVPPTAQRSTGNLTGKRISHYRVLEILGGGGMGVVYKAEDIKLGRRVALKFLPEELAGDAAAMQRFEREARAASAQNHPNICTIYAIEEFEGQPFIAMELLEGRSLRDFIAEPGPVTSSAGAKPVQLKALLEIAIQIANGLDAAHQRGIIHRDIKPANVFITNQDQAKILDFGLAKLHEFESAKTLVHTSVRPSSAAEWNPLLTLTRTGITIGTAAYMSPEQVRGEPLDSRTDLFSFGLVLYEMATRQRAFAGDSAAVLHHAVVDQTPAPVRSLNPRIPGKLETIINKAIQKERSARYATAAEMRADLEAFKHQLEPRPFRWWWATCAGIVTVLIATFSAWSVQHHHQAVPPATDLKLRQLTANSPENRVQDGLISPSGKYLAYVDRKGIHVKTIDSDELRTLPEPEALKNQKIEWALGAWFRDSARFIVNAHVAAGAEYLTHFEADEGLSAWEFPVHGDDPRLVGTKIWADHISPDGLWISFRTNRSRSGFREIWVMDANGNHRRKLFENAGSGLPWSPDGRHVWYVYNSDPEPKDNESRLLSFAWAKGDVAGAATDITPFSGLGNTFDTSMLPDGRFLHSVRDSGSIGNETCNFWTVARDPDTNKPLGKPQQLTHWTGFCMSDVSVTQDGKRLTFKQWSGHPALYIADLGRNETLVTNYRRFTESEGRESWADWTLDGKSLIYLSDRSGRPAIYKQALDTDSPELLVPPRNDLAVCCVSPDGRWLIYKVHPGSSQPSGSSEEIMRIPVSGGPSQKVLPVKRMSWWGCARAPSTLCAVAETTEDRKQAIISSFDPLNGRRTELTRISVEPNSDSTLALSPDGQRFAFIRGTGKPLQILSLKGELLREIRLPEWKPAGPITWATDLQGVYVPTLTVGGATLLHVSLRGHVYVVRENRGGNYFPGLPSPDGHHIALVGTAESGNMWLMENF